MSSFDALTTPQRLPAWGMLIHRLAEHCDTAEPSWLTSITTTQNQSLPPSARVRDEDDDEDPYAAHSRLVVGGFSANAMIGLGTLVCCAIGAS